MDTRRYFHLKNSLGLVSFCCLLKIKLLRKNVVYVATKPHPSPRAEFYITKCVFWMDTRGYFNLKNNLNLVSLCCLQTTSIPRNWTEFYSILYDFMVDFQVYTRGYISTWKMALLWIIRTSVRLNFLEWPAGFFFKWSTKPCRPHKADRAIIFFIMMRPTSRLLSLILMI